MMEDSGKYAVEYELPTGRVVTIQHDAKGTGVVIDWTGGLGGSIPTILTGKYTNFAAAKKDLELYVRSSMKKEIVKELKVERAAKKPRKKIEY